MNKSKQFAGHKTWFVLHVALKIAKHTRYSFKIIKNCQNFADKSNNMHVTAEIKPQKATNFWKKYTEKHLKQTFTL